MKKSTEVLGLKVIGIKEGTDKGVIQDMIIDAAGKKVSHLILKDSRGYAFYGLSFTDVLGIGADYAIIPSLSCVRKLYEAGDLLEAIEKGFYLLGATALSSGGDIIGTVEEFGFAQKGGAIESVKLNTGDEYTAEQIASIAGNTVFLNLYDEQEELAPVAEPEPEEEGIEADSIRFLMGKTLKATVSSDDGAFTVPAGTYLSEDVLREAARHDILLVLTLNV